MIKLIGYIRPLVSLVNLKHKKKNANELLTHSINICKQTLSITVSEQNINNQA